MKFDQHSLLLYAVTDRAWIGRQTLKLQIEEALKAGITLLQLREKHLTEEEFAKEAAEIKRLAHQYGVPLIINDNVKVALACDADGVHVGQSDMEAGNVRALLGPDKILGVTAKTVEQAKQAEKKGADYLGVGTVFTTATKPDALVITMDTVREICRSVSIPVVAIGGITRENISLFQGSGVAGAAVVSAIFGSSDITAATREMLLKAREIVGE